MFFDWTYVVIVMPFVLLSLIASASVNSTFKRYSQQFSRRGITGAQAAERVLRSNGVTGVRIERVAGNLTDHYDPRTGVIRLSDAVYQGSTSAAVGVAAHECGHAIQHANGYFPLKIRNAIVPITNIGSRLSMPLILIGIFLSYTSASYISIAYFGVACFSLCAIFQLITLPTEYNASRRAIKALEHSGRLTSGELNGSKKVLNAAALTYVAALAVSLMQLLSLLMRVRRNDRR